MGNNILNVLTEMVNEAAKEIGWEVCEGNVEYVLMTLEAEYGIELNEDSPITWQVMNVLAEVVMEWQKNTKQNYMF